MATCYGHQEHGFFQTRSSLRATQQQQESMFTFVKLEFTAIECL